MKLDIGKWAVVILLSFLASGCSSIRARTETSDNKWPVYPGVQLDVKETGKLFSSENSDPVLVKGIMSIIYAIDLPISSVFDTAVAPYDLYQSQAKK